MTATINFLDASTPPKSLQGAKGLAFYAGGDTPHQWTNAEIEALKPQYLLPIWVRSNPSVVDPAKDGRHFVDLLENYYHFPKHKLYALDMENTVDPAWVKAFLTELKGHGYEWAIIYSDKNAAGRNGSYWEWVADWTDAPHMYGNAKATQYFSGPSFDLSLFDLSLPLYQIVVPPPVVTPPKTTITQAKAALETLTKYVNGQ